MPLITHGIPARYPDSKIITSHIGGELPMRLQRADDQYASEVPDAPEPPSVAARRMWQDTVGHGHVPALRCAIDSFGADRHTDFPYENGDIFIRAVDYIDDRRSTRSPPGPSSTRTPAPWSAPDRNAELSCRHPPRQVATSAGEETSGRSG